MGADCGAIDAVVAAVRHDLSQRHRYSFPNPGFAPSAEPPIDGIPATVFGWNVPPRRSAPKTPKYAVDDRTILLGTPASATVLRLNGQQVLQNPPLSFCQIAPAQTCLQKAALNQSYDATSITLIRAALLCPKTRRCHDTSLLPGRSFARSQGSGSDRVRGRRAVPRLTDRRMLSFPSSAPRRSLRCRRRTRPAGLSQSREKVRLAS